MVLLVCKNIKTIYDPLFWGSDKNLALMYPTISSLRSLVLFTYLRIYFTIVQ
jgi:hypothetical protein